MVLYMSPSLKLPNSVKLSDANVGAEQRAQIRRGRLGLKARAGIQVDGHPPQHGLIRGRRLRVGDLVAVALERDLRRGQKPARAMSRCT